MGPSSPLLRALLPLLLLAGLAPAFAAPVPVVFAVDTSRSLTPRQLADTTVTLGEALAGLPGDTSVGLIAFDDSPRWVRPLGTSPTEILAALGELAPKGNFTLLHDAVFLALREMPEGGVIVLATDGRDENSATTIEDVANRCNAQGVRLITVGSGGRLDERTLRRLALLTTGEYAGRSGSSTTRPLLGQIQKASADVAAGRDEAAVDVPPTAAAEAAPEEMAVTAVAPPPQQVEDATAFPRSWALALGGLLLLGAIVFALSRRGKTGTPKVFCPRCGSELDASGDCAHCHDEEILAQLRQVEVAASELFTEVTAETEAFSPLSFEERLERTCVLEEQTVLVVREPGQSPRSYSLPPGRAVSVGRDSRRNTLAIPDPTLSTSHFRVVPWDGFYYLVDLGSTNGCLLNGRRQSVGKIKPGDVLKAGQIEFAIKTRQHQLGWEAAPLEA